MLMQLFHREHHAFSDTKDDPHSPWFFSGPGHMMLHTHKAYRAQVVLQSANSQMAAHPRVGLVWLDKFASSFASRVGWIVVYISFYSLFASEWWMFLLIPIHAFMGPFQGFLVNWCGHKYGYRRFKLKDHSKNTIPWDFLLLGELLQNNHHRYPGRAKFAQCWWEIDPVYPILRILDWIGVIKLRDHLEPSS